jgi:peptide/nickel transport system ATP-binding protein
MLVVDDLAIALPTTDRLIVDGVSFTLARGRTLGLVGESGSGKSMTALALMGLVPEPLRIARGSVTLSGAEVTGLSERALRDIRGARIAIIFQDPSSALNPVFTVGDQIAEAWRIHRGGSRGAARSRAVAALDEVGIPDPALRANAYPHQLSGGMRQRAMIAMALINEPEILIADEPTTALDVTVQAQILQLIKALQARRDMAMLFISHNLAVISEVADEVMVMRSGKIVERGSTETLFASPREPYTKALIAAVELRRNAQSPQPLGATILEAADLTKRFAIREPGLFGRRRGEVQALTGVSLALRKGETLAVVGESGSGKSTLAKTVLGLHPSDGGTLTLGGRTMEAHAAARPAEIRRRLQMVFQDPYASLNPRLTAGDTIAEPLVIHRIGTAAERRAKSAEAARAVGIDPASLDKYPHEFSGGERQRIAIARAVVAEPELIIADEPMSSLDVTIQAQVIDLLQTLKQRLALTYLLISHDLAVVAHMADRVAVMYGGRIVELADSESVFANPQHPYTKVLIDSAPRIGRARAHGVAVRGEAASAVHPPSGCPFHPRCPKVKEICRTQRPSLTAIGAAPSAHAAACHYPGAT